MAVALSSDLVMDVMRNADPARRNVAVARLQAASGSPEVQTAFEGVVDSVHPMDAVNAGPPLALTFSGRRTVSKPPETPYQGFEQMVLRNLFETLLPESESGAFGSGPSADIWRSMAADQMAGVYADAGGVGIARMLENRGNDTPSHQGQWPYFSVAQIKDFEG